MANEDNNGGASGGLGTGDSFLDIVGAFLILLLVVQLAQILPTLVSEIFNNIQARLSGVEQFATIHTWLQVIGVSFSLTTLIGAVYAGLQLSQIRIAERKELNELTKAAVGGPEAPNERWEQILSYVASDDQELWRLAIIEADVMMDEMLQTMGYGQASLGEKLKNAEESDFRTLDEAWKAHKLRNIIAHKGSMYELDRPELEEAINNYRRVFNEFSYI